MTVAVRRGRRFDARLVIGLALVLGSVGGVAAVLGAADSRIPVYATITPVAPGERITTADLVIREVALDGAEGLYVAAGQVPGAGLVAARALDAGELLTVSAVGDVRSLASTAIVLELVTPLSAAAEAGDPLELWAVATGASRDATGDPPRVLVSDAILVGVHGTSGFGGGGERGRVEVLIPRTRVAAVLEAVAGAAAIAALPAGLPWGAE